MLRSALLSTGGMGNVPMLHDDLVKRGLATDGQFAQSLAVGQISPGPNGLWVVCLGYFLGGWRSSAAALVAISLPPLVILLIAKLYERHRRHPAVEGFMTGLEIAVLGVFGVVMAGFLAGSPHTWLTVLVSVSAFGAALLGRIPTAVILIGAAILAIVAK